MAGHDPIRQALVELLPDLRAYARFLVRESSRADDLVQETMLRALAAAGQFQAGTNAKAWLFTIQRNLFLQNARSLRREDAAMRRHAEASEGAVQNHSSELTDLAALLWTLQPAQREALLLVGAQEFSHEEAAAICGVAPGTMRARVSRARAELARVYAHHAEKAA